MVGFDQTRILHVADSIVFGEPTQSNRNALIDVRALAACTKSNLTRLTSPFLRPNPCTKPKNILDFRQKFWSISCQLPKFPRP